VLNERYPHYSYLAFTELPDSMENELLFVSEISTHPIRSELVVLSACQTASGKLYRGEGMSSIGQAFLLAGAKGILSSLWNVDDQQAPVLMSTFYEHLEEGIAKPSALQQAQVAYLGKSSFRMAHPYFWAGFVGLGDPAPLSDRDDGKWWWMIIAGFVVFSLIWFLRKNKSPSDFASEPN
jgi:CHAT domain-containing protein